MCVISALFQCAIKKICEVCEGKPYLCKRVISMNSSEAAKFVIGMKLYFEAVL